MSAPRRTDHGQLVAELATNRAEAERLAAGLTSESAVWRPEPTRWSVADCLAHLDTTAAQYLPKIEQAITGGRERGRTGAGPYPLGVLLRFFIAEMEPPPKRRLRAPKGFLPPGGDWHAIRTAFFTSHDALANRLEQARGLDLGRIWLTSPVSALLRMRLGTAFALVAAHERRHLWQAAQVAALAGVPS